MLLLDTGLVVATTDNLCIFHMLSWNNLANPSANVPSIVTTKYVILDNLSHTTKITFFPATNDKLVIKSTIKYVYCYELKSLGLDNKTTLVLSNTRELNRELCTR